MELNADGLERLVPDELRAGDTTGQETLALHVERYEFAARYVHPGRLLDCACGVGYGTRILVDRAAEPVRGTGVDISLAAIEYARERYGRDRIRFVRSDAMEFECSDGFDTIVSIETIEHLPEPSRFVDHMLRQLRGGGIFVASVPITPSVDANLHHLHDFSESSFRGLVARHGLVELASLEQDQPYRLGSILTRGEARMEDLRRNLPAYYLSHPGALARRVASVLRHGFKNRYLTVAWRSPA